MKTNFNSFTKLFLMVFIFSTTVIYLSCENKEQAGDQVQYSENILSISDCKKDQQVFSSSLDTEEPCITLTTVDSNYIAVEHKNAVFYCIYDKISIDFSVDDNVITVKEIEEGANSFCTCNYDIDYKIGPFDFDQYTIKIQDGEQNELLSFDFDFTANTLETYCEE